MKIKRSITLKEGEVNRSKDSQKETRSRANGGKRPMDFVKLAAAAVAGTLLFTAGADARKLKSPDTAPALRGKDLTDRTPFSLPAFDQGATDKKILSELGVPPALQGGFSAPEGQTVDKIWPGLGKLMDEHIREKTEKVSKGLYQGDAQGKDEREISQDPMDAPSDRLEQDKSKGVEGPELRKEETDSLKSFVTSLEKDKGALQGFKEILENKEAMEGIENLMRDKEFRKCALLPELKNEESVKQAISLLESRQAASLLMNKEVVEICKQITKNGEIERRILKGKGSRRGKSNFDIGDSTDDDSGSEKSGVIGGGIVGGILVVAGAYWCYRYRRVVKQNEAFLAQWARERAMHPVWSGPSGFR